MGRISQSRISKLPIGSVDNSYFSKDQKVNIKRIMLFRRVDSDDR